MSLIVAVYTFDGIVVAGDKRITLTIPNKKGNKLIDHFASTDNEEKVILSKNDFSIMYFNDASIARVPTSKCIKDFLRQNDNFDLTSKLAWALRKYLLSLSPNCKVSLIVSGYQNGKQSIFEVHTNDESSKEWVDPMLGVGIVYAGKDETIKSLLSTYNILFDNMRIADAISFCEFAIQSTSKLLSFSDEPCVVSPTYDIAVITPDGSWWVTPREPYA